MQASRGKELLAPHQLRWPRGFAHFYVAPALLFAKPSRCSRLIDRRVSTEARPGTRWHPLAPSGHPALRCLPSLGSRRPQSNLAWRCTEPCSVWPLWATLPPGALAPFFPLARPVGRQTDVGRRGWPCTPSQTGMCAGLHHALQPSCLIQQVATPCVCVARNLSRCAQHAAGVKQPDISPSFLLCRASVSRLVFYPPPADATLSTDLADQSYRLLYKHTPQGKQKTALDVSQMLKSSLHRRDCAAFRFETEPS